MAYGLIIESTYTFNVWATVNA